MRKQFTFKKSDLEKSFVDPSGCPIYTAMKRSGIPVFTVGPVSWSDVDKEGMPNNDIKLTPSLMKASSILALAHRSKNIWRLKNKAALAGRSFKVTF